MFSHPHPAPPQAFPIQPVALLLTWLFERKTYKFAFTFPYPSPLILSISKAYCLYTMPRIYLLFTIL